MYVLLGGVGQMKQVKGVGSGGGNGDEGGVRQVVMHKPNWGRDYDQFSDMEALSWLTEEMWDHMEADLNLLPQHIYDLIAEHVKSHFGIVEDDLETVLIHRVAAHNLHVVFPRVTMVLQWECPFDSSHAIVHHGHQHGQSSHPLPLPISIVALLSQNSSSALPPQESSASNSAVSAQDSSSSPALDHHPVPFLPLMASTPLDELREGGNLATVQCKCCKSGFRLLHIEIK
jgi:hypothetical protein